jgi:hypothetical protein
MNALLLGIKTALTTAIPALAGRIFFGAVGEGTTLATGAYAVVSWVSDFAQHAFDDDDGVDNVQYQISIFDKQLATAGSMREQVNDALNNQTLTLSTGEVVKGTRVMRGELALPPSDLPAGVRRGFNAFVVLEWTVTNE